MSDYLALGSNILLLISMIPTILSDKKPHWWTCLLATIGLGGLTFVYILQNLTFAAVTCALMALLWAVVLVQAFRQQTRQTIQDS